MPSVYLPCPQCGEEIESLMEWERGDYSIGLFGGWVPNGYVQSCACVLTADEEEALAEEATKVANADPQFGVPDHLIPTVRGEVY